MRIDTYEPLRDLTPLGMSTIWPMAMVFRANAPFKNLKEMVEHDKKNPGNVRCGTLGVKSIGDINVELLQMLTGTHMSVIPFKGASPGLTALLGGHIEVYSTSLSVSLTHLRSGALKGIALSTKFPELKDIPTLKELGYEYDMFSVWGGWFAPVGVPPEITKTLVPAIEKVARNPGIASKLTELGIYQEYASLEKLTTRMEADYKMIKEFAKKLGW